MPSPFVILLSPAAFLARLATHDSSDDPRANPSVEPRPPRSNEVIGRLALFLVLSHAIASLVDPSSARAAGAGFATGGVYCPIPEPGESPSCQAPARERYAEFFDAVESGQLDPTQTAQIEEALARSGDERGTYLALSSLTYGYYRLAHEASRKPRANRRLTARLVRWNELLTKVYGAESTPPALKAAVRSAAEDLARRAPAVGVTCTAGREQDCEAVRGLLGALAAVDERTSMRSPLSRVIERLLGPNDAALGHPSEDR